MVDDGYLIGYEDTNGDFVEVGRFNNQAEDTNQPVEIVHAGSGEKVELGPGGFDANNITANSVNTERVGSNRHYADAYSGGDADARLDAAISDASEGDVIYLERATYTTNRTINKSLTLEGLGGFSSTENADISGDWTIDTNSVILSRVVLSGSSLDANGRFFTITDSTIQGSSSVTIGANDTRVIGNIIFGSVTFESGTIDGIADANTPSGGSITDNGTNTVGDGP